MPGVSIVTSTIKPRFMDNVFANYDRQKWEEKELIVILNKDSMNLKWWKKKASAYPNVSVYQLPEEETLGQCLNFGIKKSRYRYVAKFDDDDYYSPNYLSQAMEAFERTEAVFVGKRMTYMYFQNERLLTVGGSKRIFENQYIKKVMKGGTLVFDKTIFPEVKFPPKNRSVDVGIQRQSLAQGLKMYTTDKKNYVYMRYDDEMHTSLKKNADLIKNNKWIARTEDFTSYVSDEKKDFFRRLYEFLFKGD